MLAFQKMQDRQNGLLENINEKLGCLLVIVVIGVVGAVLLKIFAL